MTVFERIYMSIAMMRDRHEGDKGASMIEYAILVTLMAAVVATAVGLLGDKITGYINTINF